MHDIYDPPPAPVADEQPEPEPLTWTRADLAFLVVPCLALLAASFALWRTEPTVAALTTLGGSLVLLESWFTALGFLHKYPARGLGARLKIFLAALVPWVLGLGVAAALMVGLFLVTDRIG